MVSPTKYEAAQTLFREKAPGIVDKLMGDFSIGLTDAFAILGNIGHECFGFTLLQEQAPSVKGSRGGWGWCQWTGARRRDFEAYCRRTGKDPASDEANYAWLWVELKGGENAALSKLLTAPGLEVKTIAFCRSFLRPGIAHEDSRIQWAKVAQSAYAARGSAPPVLTPVEDKGEMIAAATGAAQTQSNKTALKTWATAIGGATITAGKQAPNASHLADWLVLGFGVATIALVMFGVWWLLSARERRAMRNLAKVKRMEGAGQ